jgi:thiamine-phosphate pyrophosphorylase
MADDFLPAGSPILRILDAAANRAREALRVLEDYARFSLNDEPLTAQLKGLRHELADMLVLLPMNRALLARDTPGDVGTGIKTAAELRRSSLRDVLTANAKRLSESLRSLEECAKTITPFAALKFEQLRYRGYTVEQALAKTSAMHLALERFRGVRLYVLLTADLCGSRPQDQGAAAWERILAEILEAASSHQGGAASLCIQLREKQLQDAELLRRARHLVQACHKLGALAIINDRPDIALLAGADGVHLGQTDLPCAEVRRLLGPDLIVGVSTENLDQAHQAVAEGATYVAAGPMFSSTTKHKPRIAGPEYASQALASIERPVVAIGGITLENIEALTSLGIRTVAVSAAILRSPDAGAAVQAFLNALSRSAARA